ncbi:hypothetical protein evm_013102 [Chilo suppressalis]|nr:hypothetical protein evm_013102 [Chilo suppressalis]
MLVFITQTSAPTGIQPRTSRVGDAMKPGVQTTRPRRSSWIQKKATEVSGWLKNQPHSNAARRECGSDALEPEEMKALWSTLETQLQTLKDKEKKVTLHVKWNLLYKPELHEGNISPDPRADFKMYDRIVCVSRSITVPLAATGTVTAVYLPPPPNTVRLSDRLNVEPSYQVMFDEPFPGAMTEDLFDEPRFYRMLPTNMLNISYGRKLRNSISCAPETFTRAPTLLRRDGNHSAFASYSPPTTTTEMKPIQFVKENATASTKNGPQENATHLLRSLLKISEDEEQAKKNNIKGANDQNWRKKENSSQPPLLPTPKGPQQNNWRKEMTHKPQQAQVANEWTNANFKNQPPVPPFPNFGQPFQGPVPNQIPFPQFQNPHFQRNQNHHGNQEVNTRNQNHNQYSNNQFSNRTHHNQGFPKHLPSVSGSNVTLGPSWGQGQQQQAAASKPNSNQTSSAEKLSNPFVPLQVQTSQRRIQNTSGPSTKEEMPAPKPSQPRPQPTNQNVQPLRQDSSSRPQKKKKPRIAANLPFQID